MDTKDKHIAILDYTGKLADAIEQEAAKRSELEIFRGEDRRAGKRLRDMSWSRCAGGGTTRIK